MLVLLRNTDLEIQVRGQWDLQGDTTISGMTMWSSPSGGGAWETTMENMEGDRGNRGKARLSSERGISRRYRAKPYVPQIRRPYFNNSHFTQLSQLPHPNRKATRDPILEIVTFGFRKNEIVVAFDFVALSRKYFTFSLHLRNHIRFNRETRAEFRSHRGFTRPHEIVNRSRETSPLTDFGNHFIAHYLLARNWTQPSVIQCMQYSFVIRSAIILAQLPPDSLAIAFMIYDWKQWFLWPA